MGWCLGEILLLSFGVLSFGFFFDMVNFFIDKLLNFVWGLLDFIVVEFGV